MVNLKEEVRNFHAEKAVPQRSLVGDGADVAEMDRNKKLQRQLSHDEVEFFQRCSFEGHLEEDPDSQVHLRYKDLRFVSFEILKHHFIRIQFR